MAILCCCCSFGYKPFMQSIATQSKQLQTIVEENLASSRLHMTSSSRLRSSSTSSTDSKSTVGTLEQQASMERDVVDDLVDLDGSGGGGDVTEQQAVEDAGCTLS